MKRMQGFTLIELIVVIVILGILAATALPKFMDLGGDARSAVVDGLEGSVRSTSAMIYAKAAIKGQTGATGSLTTTDIPQLSSAMDLVHGYPKDAAELAKAMDIDTTNKFSVASDKSGISLKGKAVTDCGVAYSQPSGAGLAPTITANKGSC